MLPNFCFMLFPVVDYRTWQRGYFAADVHAIQRRGLEMTFRGAVQLILYRIIDQELLIQSSEVAGPWSLLGFLVFNYLVYLQVSGQFHIACGMLHLFGYQLPDTHHRYLLATGFTDYWRRINIYWKDFMVRLVFNPVVFRLKKWPQPAALAAATAAVFVVTWLLHGYQSFWLRGTWGFTVPDAVFWTVLGGLVMVNVQVDARKGPARPRLKPKADEPPAGVDYKALAIRCAKTAATFATIILLWSLWNSPSVADWLDLLARGFRAS
jgi:D-alanyl-lipoteichoic acid acyltransferase DltB (MBOAT superfamily)